MRSASALLRELRDTAAEAAELENQGADIASTLEIGHDPWRSTGIRGVCRAADDRKWRRGS